VNNRATVMLFHMSPKHTPVDQQWVALGKTTFAQASFEVKGIRSTEIKTQTHLKTGIIG